jgi:precorrin-6Y C5,15-methyltransferase (decarboxylating)
MAGPAANVEGFIQPDARLLILTEDETSVAEVCRRLVARGFGESRVTVLENMGGDAEAVTFLHGRQPSGAADWSPLNTLAVHCIAGSGAKIWSRVAGLPDDAFAHDGKITKREIRAMTLAALAPAPDQLALGCGCRLWFRRHRMDARRRGAARRLPSSRTLSGVP